MKLNMHPMAVGPDQHLVYKVSALCRGVLSMQKEKRLDGAEAS
jgi:hypothetical protein